MMQSAQNAARAYGAATTYRGDRAREADVFRRATGALRAARAGDALTRTRALADNRLLWRTVIDLVRDPENALPEQLRAAIVSVGRAVQREMDQSRPSYEFLIAVNENIAAGLDGEG